MREICLLFVIVGLSVSAISCGFYHRPVQLGIDVLSYWTGIRFPYQSYTGADIDKLKTELLTKVEQYVSERPNLPQTKRAQLRKLIVYRGMNREESLLLLGKADEILRDLVEIEKRAGSFWTAVRERVQEVWVYRRYTLFFDADQVFEITDQGWLPL